MIDLQRVGKQYPSRHGMVTVMENLNLRIRRGERVGILGRNGTGKSTLIRLISGAEMPTSGSIARSMSVSWPLAFTGAFQGALTGMDNLKFICRVYGVDPRSRVGFVQDFSELGRALYEPMKTYSSGMRARLAFAISMAVDFDCFLIDEVIAVGDARFHERCRVELFEKRGDRAFVIVSHEEHNIRAHCQRACVLHQKRLHEFADVDTAFAFYNEVSAAG